MGAKKLQSKGFVALGRRLRASLAYRCDRAGRSLRDWQAQLLLRGLVRWGSRPFAVTGQPAIIFSPHQDDEVLGCGGLIALKRALGASVQVVFLTDGSGSHRGHPTLDPADLVHLRRQEAILALQTLQVPTEHIHFLNWPDGQLHALASDQRLITQIVQLLNVVQPREVYVPHRHDCHPDHEATYALVQAALAQSTAQMDCIQYPIWVLWQTAALFPANWAKAHRLSIASVQDCKQRAIAAYRSQCQSIDAIAPPVLSSGFLKRFQYPYEIFFKTDA
jgi:N-acetylglucosamine malate deacetylase 1